MARYIDADVFDDTVQRLNEQGWNITNIDYKRMDRVLFEMPTADVVEVVHGKWVVCDAPPPTWWHECSICHKAGNAEYNFCPHCGADMRRK